MQKQFQSTVGCVVDIATPATRKLRALGFLWTMIALVPLVLLNYVIFDFLGSSDSILSGHPLTFLGLLLMPMIGWFALGSAVQRFRAASTDGRYFRSGPGGISVCLPDDYGRSTFRFSLKIFKLDVPWDQIKTWYPYTQTTNGIPTERTVVFETVKNEKIKVKTYHFAESQKQIVASITRSRSIVPEEVLAERIEQLEGEEQFSLPSNARDSSFEIKKKRERVKQIDLRTVAKGQRAACVERIAGAVEAKLMSLCPSFRCSRKSYRPFKEWKDVSGVRLFVRRGLLHGYEIQVGPDDSEFRRLTISMCASSLITDIRRYLSMAAGAVFVVISFRWLGTVDNWLGDFAQLTPLVFVAMFVAVVAAATGLFELPIIASRWLFTNKEREEAQKHGIKVGIQEVTG